MIYRRVIQGESSSSNPDVGRFSPDSLRSGNHRKSLEVLAFNLHVKAHVKTSIKSTARGTNAPHFSWNMWLLLVPARRCHSVHHDQGQKLAKDQVRGKSSAAWPDQAPVAGLSGVRTCPPWTWFWSDAITELKRRTPTTTLVELKEIIESFAQSMDEEEVKQAVRGSRRRAHACLERNSAAFEERQ